jgi:hypothetical protein
MCVTLAWGLHHTAIGAKIRQRRRLATTSSAHFRGPKTRQRHAPFIVLSNLRLENGFCFPSRSTATDVDIFTRSLPNVLPASRFARFRETSYYHQLCPRRRFLAYGAYIKLSLPHSAMRRDVVLLARGSPHPVFQAEILLGACRRIDRCSFPIGCPLHIKGRG